jgi:hypothetical protein
MSTDGFIKINPESAGPAIDNAVFMRDGKKIYRQRVEMYPSAMISLDAGGRSRVSQITTLFDGKTLRQEDVDLWDTKGTGTRTFEDGSINKLDVAAGQYLVRQSKQYMPYFSGKSQIIELTFDTFGLEIGIIKRYGYFSSNAVAPYASNLDGWYIESNGDTEQFYLVVVNNGTEKLRLDWTQWSNYEAIASLDWDNFNVSLIDFLWLGGAILRAFQKMPTGGFPEAHVYDYAGSAPGVFMRSPNQPVRYEIRSTGGTGTFRAICSVVGTEGSLNNQSKPLVLRHDTLILANSVGTIYAVKGVKKRADFRDIPVEINQFGGSMTATADAGVWLLLLNPTLSAPLTYIQKSAVDEATATNQTVTNVGREIGIIHVNQAGVSIPFADNQLAWMGINIDNTPDEYVLAYQPLTLNQSINGAMTLQVF